MHFLGIDIGGTKTGVCIATEAGKILASRRMRAEPYEAIESYRTRLTSICAEVAEAAAVPLETIEAVGISAPGPLDIRRGLLIRPPNNPGWVNVPIVSLVREALNKPVYLNNDANSCALAEMLFGSHGKVENLIYLTLSTGMGGGIIVNGRLVQGITDTGGEVGHHVVDPKGPLCPCGQRGCWEVYVGGYNVAERLKARIRQQQLKTKIVEKAGGVVDNITMQALEAAAREGDPVAVEEWDQLAERLAQGIGSLIMILNPEIIVLGTIAIRVGDFIMVPLREKLKKYAWEWPLRACRIVPSSLGDRIGDLSAIAVALTGLKEECAR